MHRKLGNLIAGILGVGALMILGLWVLSYIRVVTAEYVYFCSLGDVVDGDKVLHGGITKAWDFSVAGGSILMTKPYVDGTPYGWRFSSESYADCAKNMSASLPGSRFGFYIRPGITIMPIWPIAYALAVIPVLYFSRQYRKRSIHDLLNAYANAAA